MISTPEIEKAKIKDLRDNFMSLMEEIVEGYGDGPPATSEQTNTAPEQTKTEQKAGA